MHKNGKDVVPLPPDDRDLGEKWLLALPRDFRPPPTAITAILENHYVLGRKQFLAAWHHHEVNVVYTGTQRGIARVITGDSRHSDDRAVAARAAGRGTPTSALPKRPMVGNQLGDGLIHSGFFWPTTCLCTLCGATSARFGARRASMSAREAMLPPQTEQPTPIRARSVIRRHSLGASPDPGAVFASPMNIVAGGRFVRHQNVTPSPLREAGKVKVEEDTRERTPEQLNKLLSIGKWVTDGEQEVRSSRTRARAERVDARARGRSAHGLVGWRVRAGGRAWYGFTRR